MKTHLEKIKTYEFASPEDSKSENQEDEEFRQYFWKENFKEISPILAYKSQNSSPFCFEVLDNYDCEGTNSLFCHYISEPALEEAKSSLKLLNQEASQNFETIVLENLHNSSNSSFAQSKKKE